MISGYYTDVVYTSGSLFSYDIDKPAKTELLPPELEAKNTLEYMLKSLEEKDFDNFKKWFGILKENVERLEVEIHLI